MRIAELSLDLGRVDVAAVLREVVSFPSIQFALLETLPSTTYLARVLSFSQCGFIWVFLLDSPATLHGLGQESSLLDDGESSNGSQGRCPHKSTREHLDSHQQLSRIGQEGAAAVRITLAPWMAAMLGCVIDCDDLTASRCRLSSSLRSSCRPLIGQIMCKAGAPSNSLVILVGRIIKAAHAGRGFSSIFIVLLTTGLFITKHAVASHTGR
jgi:hypothetical protein